MTGAHMTHERQDMIVTTTTTLDGYAIEEYLGIVNGVAILGVNVVRDLFAGIRDIVGGRSGAYEKELQKARDIALQELRDAAAELGGNAVIGVDIDYETISDSMLMVTASGTAIRTRRTV